MPKNNTGLKIISLIIAIVLWGYVVYGTNPVETQTLTNIPVKIVNMSSIEEQGLTIQNTEGFAVNVKVQGTKKDISSIDMSMLKVTADVSGYGEGIITVPVKAVMMDEALDVVDVKPAQIELHVEKLASQQKEIHVNFDGEIPENMNASYSNINPTKAQVSGAESKVNEVVFLKATIATSALTPYDDEHMIELVAIDRAGAVVNDITISPATATLTASMKEVIIPEPVNNDTDNDGEDEGPGGSETDDNGQGEGGEHENGGEPDSEQNEQNGTEAL